LNRRALRAGFQQQHQQERYGTGRSHGDVLRVAD
jgi:hypothetical protein